MVLEWEGKLWQNFVTWAASDSRSKVDIKYRIAQARKDQNEKIEMKELNPGPPLSTGYSLPTELSKLTKQPLQDSPPILYAWIQAPLQYNLLDHIQNFNEKQILSKLISYVQWVGVKGYDTQ